MDTLSLNLSRAMLLGALAGVALAGAAAAEDGPFFIDQATPSGLVFEHWTARTGALYFPEMTGQGAALFDADGDGDLDVYLVQGAYLRPEDRGKTLEDPPSEKPGDRLFRNDTKAGGPPRFTDITRASGLEARGYGMAVATGDVDGDGDVDLFLANYGPDELWLNRGDGTFENRTAKAGVAGSGTWSTGATLADLNGDGWLDLYVIDYVRFDVKNNPVCYASSSRPDYCGPSSFPPATNRFYRNRGDGTFEDLTAASGLGQAAGASLGVVAADFDEDGRLDLYVANDGQPNHLWLNRGDGTFADEALLAGLAFNREGQPEASMGIAIGDLDADRDLDLFLTHLANETNTLYLNQGGALFDDRSIESGLAAPSLALTSFGTAALDVDNDGWLDLVVASGAVRIVEELRAAGVSYPLGQPNQLFLNRSGRFTDASSRAGADFQKLDVGRGLAFGDVDNDGDADVVLANNGSATRLLINQVGQKSPWVGLRLMHQGPGQAPRPAHGAVAELRRASGAPLLRRSATDGSYASASDPRLIFGLGGGSAENPPTGVLVRWEDGTLEEFGPPPAGRYTDLIRGQGAKPAAAAPKKDSAR
ncbi:MAG: CRTAC1 family protein [Acidobacteriota bacterium]